MSSDAINAENADKLRIVVIYRADLPEMTPGKAEIQYGHATASVLYKAMLRDPERVARYMAENQVKVSLEVATLDDLLKIEKKANARGVVNELITDAAFTVFKEPTTTCIGLGPMSKTDSNALTRGATKRP